MKPASANSKMPARTLGVLAIMMINIIAVSSLRGLPFSATYGFSLVFFFTLAAIIFFLPAALISAELATGWPNRGGVYVWVREAFGEFWGFFIIWAQWIYNIVWYPTILAFMAGTLAYLLNPAWVESKVYMLSVILIVFWTATFLNWFGMRVTSWVSTLSALIGTLFPMFFIISLGFIWITQGNPIQTEISVNSFFPDLYDMKNLSFLLIVFFALVGMEMSAVHADEVKNPGKSYPKAIFISTIIIFFGLVLSSLAIAIVVPNQALSVVTGLVQAYKIFFDSYGLNWMTPVIGALIVFGAIGAVSAWVIGPTKGLLVAVVDGNAPAFLGKTNKHGVPVVLLSLQAIICSIMCIVFFLMPTVAASYWVLSVLTGQLAMVVYIALFAAAIRLRYKHANVVREYKVPGGNGMMWLLGLMGAAASIFAISIGFIPPAKVDVGDVFKYEVLLIIGLVTLSLPPLIMYANRKKYKRSL
ncbi:MAG: putative transporter [Gammaproteobacteria bacterium]|jgi:amino acid transporter|nr:putative transporter [Gammaproteobacteria bacterium]